MNRNATGGRCDKSDRGDFTHQLELRLALLHLESLQLICDEAQSQLPVRLDALAMVSRPLSDQLTADDGPLEQIWSTLQLEDSADDDDADDVSALTNLLGESVKLSIDSESAPNHLPDEYSGLWTDFRRIMSKLKERFAGERVTQVSYLSLCFDRLSHVFLLFLPVPDC